MLFDEFLGEIETDNFTASNSEITTFGFLLFGTTFFLSIEYPVERLIRTFGFGEYFT